MEEGKGNLLLISRSLLNISTYIIDFANKSLHISLPVSQILKWIHFENEILNVYSFAKYFFCIEIDFLQEFVYYRLNWPPRL